MDRSQLQPDEVFCAAAEMASPAERTAYLDQVCGDAEDLRRRVERLLQAHEQAGSFLAARPRVAAATTDLPAEVVDTVIGPYKLLEQIGEGGFGVVFMAEQQQPMRRKIALKILKPGMDTRQVIARFEAERQALALMDHPHIARVFDGGETASGRPYFAMELVRGIPITEFCDQNHSPVAGRLELFICVCQAVQHAHQKGIIHRDLKPTNVLVTLHDDKAVVKVIDFGIAKATGRQLTDKTLFTSFAQMIGTPLYMSPEQAALSGLDVDTRSDIYSLGVLLYELLTGTTPFNEERFRQADYDEIRRIIREEEPPKPSTRISTLGQAATTVSTRRKSDPKRLSQLFRGELDWIVMKCLEKDRDRRYESASALAADVQRYLKNEPVHACPPSAWYRGRKFARRNKVTMAISGLASLVLVTLVVGLVVSNWLIRREQNRTAEQRDSAEANFRLALESVNRYFTQVSENPKLKARDLEGLRRDLLRTAQEFYERFVAERQDDPNLQAELGRAYGRLGQITDMLGSRSDAIALKQQAAEIFDRLVGQHADVAEYQKCQVVSVCDLGISYRDSGRVKEAETTFHRALAIAERLVREQPDVPDYHLLLEGCLYNLASVYSYTRRWDKAEAAQERAISVLEQIPGKPSHFSARQDELALSYNHLGVIYQKTGRKAKAEAAYKKSLLIQEPIAGKKLSDPSYQYHLGEILKNLGNLFQDSGRWAEAEGAYLEGLRVEERLAGEHPAIPEYHYRLAKNRITLGMMYRARRQWTEAEANYKKALSILERLASDYPNWLGYQYDLADGNYDLGALYAEAGRWTDAEAAYLRNLPIRERLAKEQPNVHNFQSLLASNEMALGIVYMEVHRWGEAEAGFQKAIVILERLSHAYATVWGYATNLGGVYCNMGNLLKNQDKAKDALAWYAKSIGTLGTVLAANAGQVQARQFLLNAHVGRAQALASLGRWAEAIKDWDRVVALEAESARPLWRLQLALTTVHMGQHARATADAEELVRGKQVTSGFLYDLACVFALASAAVKQEPSLRERYAARAMELLRQATEKGYRDVDHIERDNDLDAIRARADFIKLLGELREKAEALKREKPAAVKK